MYMCMSMRCTSPACDELAWLRWQGELACGLLVRDQAHKETISFALQFGTSATWRVVAIPDNKADEPYIVHEYSQEEFAEIHRRVGQARWPLLPITTTLLITCLLRQDLWGSWSDAPSLRKCHLSNGHTLR